MIEVIDREQEQKDLGITAFDVTYIDGSSSTTFIPRDLTTEPVLNNLEGSHHAVCKM